MKLAVHYTNRIRRFFLSTALILFCISGVCQLTASFSANTLSGCAPLIVNFQDLSTGNPTSWQWNLGNGTLSNQQNPSTSYFNPGIYTISLKVSNASGTDSITQIGYITVYLKPTTNFSVSDSSGCFPLRVNFSDRSVSGSGNLTSWSWDLGDGDTSSFQNPAHIYTISGNYSVTLKVTNSNGCVDALSKNQYVKVTPGVTVGFTNSLATQCKPPETINFTNLSTGPPSLSYQWDFGDGNTSIDSSPAHTYNNGGTYSVELITKSSVGCYDSLLKQNIISVLNYSTNFTGPDSICIASIATFNNVSSPTPSATLWNFGDTTNFLPDTISTTLSSVSKTWNNAGLYQVKMISNYGVCKDTATKLLTVISPPVPNFTSSDTTRCKAPFTVQFTDLTIGSTTWLWNFGDGTTSTLKNPTHTFDTLGQFNITLKVTNAFGCSSTISKPNYIRIVAPSASIVNLPLGACIPFSYNAVANITDPKGVASYLWDFGDGTTSNLQSPTHTYSSSGTYNVKLYYTTSDGCSDSAIYNSGIKTGTPPAVNFTATPLSQCAGQNIQFTDMSVPADAWSWNFGDGTNSILRNPVHAYQTANTFTVTLTASNNGCLASLTKNNYVQALPPVAKFTPVFNCTNKTQVQFTDNSTLPQTWFWDFGDGNTSTLQNPTHTYSVLGNDTVSLTVTNGGCSNTVKKPITLVDENPDFIVNQDTICTFGRIIVTADNINANNITRYLVNFGDGTIQGPQNPQGHNYPNNGIYTVSLTITDIHGCETTITKPNLIDVDGPEANFSSSPLSGCIGLNVLFTDSSVSDGVHPIINWQWTYGDGIIQNSSGPPFSHSYNSAGNFLVKLKVTDTNGCFDSLIADTPIVITNPTAGFSSPDTLVCPGSNVIFTNYSSGVNLSYAWTLGNGITSTQANPVTAYYGDSSYTVKLIVTDINGCRDSIQQFNYINVKMPKAFFTINDSVGSCSPFEVDFTNNSVNNTSQTWDFGDGSSSSLSNPVHYYNTPGTYIATLYATLPGGCVDSFKRTITLYASPANLSYIPLSGCKEVTVSFHVSSGGPVTYFWDFGDGNTISGTDSNAINNYNNPGNFIPKVIITDPAGCQVLLTGSDTIHLSKSYVSFSVADSITCPGTSLVFTNSTISNSIVVSWYWDFGDGTVSNLPNPVHSYQQEGFYTVELIATTLFGCSDTLIRTNYIKVNRTPSIAINGSTSSCATDSVKFSGIWLNPDTSTLVWHWNFGNGNYSSLQNPMQEYYDSAGNYTVQLIATSLSGCADTTNSGLIIHPLPVTNAGSNTYVCLNKSIQLRGTGADNYTWLPADYLSCSVCSNPVSTPLNTIVYYLKGSNQYGCETTDSVTLTVIKPFKLTVMPVSDSVCAGQSVQVTATGTDQYAWSPQDGLNNPAINNPIATPYNTTSYSVIGTDNEDCFADTASILISVILYPAVNTGADKNIPFGQPVTLTPEYSKDVTSWLWSPATGLSCTDCPDPIASPPTSTIYTITVTNSAGCSSKDTIAVSYPCQVSIFIPNTFSPNNDGVNDVFYPRGKDIYLIQSMRIFDRWGEMVFQRTNFSPNVESLGWDGTFKGRPASCDVYTYVIEVICNNSNISTFQGDVTLIR